VRTTAVQKITVTKLLQFSYMPVIATKCFFIFLFFIYNLVDLFSGTQKFFVPIAPSPPT
jgi:hypothetical protein